MLFHMLLHCLTDRHFSFLFLFFIFFGLIFIAKTVQEKRECYIGRN